MWPGVIVAGVILGRGDFGQGLSRFRGDSGGVIFVRGDCGFIPNFSYSHFHTQVFIP